jgi:hypothetical protein
MSREFDTPIGTIKRRLHVARNRLRRQLERKESKVRAAGYPVQAYRPERELACV